jgi:predicted RecB family nuclease
MPKGILKICPKAHRFYKSSDCPTCPVCESERRPGKGFLGLLSAPARRALENAGVKTLTQLSKKFEADILNLHGMGPASLPVLRKELKKEGLTFFKH